jgi:hypothetical protein
VFNHGATPQEGIVIACDRGVGEAYLAAYFRVVEAKETPHSYVIKIEGFADIDEAALRPPSKAEYLL